MSHYSDDQITAALLRDSSARSPKIGGQSARRYRADLARA